ncbi:MAG TPA: hypothetical protein VIL73_01150 [Gaiellaceae bacterium]
MGDIPNARPKLVVNDPMLRSPTVRQMSATAIGVAQQRSCALEPAGEEVLVRRLAEGAPELAAEVRRREPRSACEGRHVERVPVAGVDQVLGAEEVPGRRYGDHRLSIAAAASFGPGSVMAASTRAAC